MLNERGMFGFTEEDRQQRRQLQAGDRVAVVRPSGKVEIETVTSATPISIFIGRYEYDRITGYQRAKFRTGRVRGLATREELAALTDTDGESTGGSCAESRRLEDHG